MSKDEQVKTGGGGEARMEACEQMQSTDVPTATEICPCLHAIYEETKDRDILSDTRK